MLTTPKTQLEKDLAEKDASILMADNARFWSLLGDRI